MVASEGLEKTRACLNEFPRTDGLMSLLKDVKVISFFSIFGVGLSAP